MPRAAILSLLVVGSFARGQAWMGDVYRPASRGLIVDGGVIVQGQLVVDGGVLVQAAETRGLKTLSGGSGTVTVLSGAACVCSLSTSAGTAAPKCSVSGTTLTITGTGTDVIAYHCL